jgi:hypothetical protein
MSQPTWATIASTIQGVIAAASGLPTIWRYQDADQPALDYVAISLGASTQEGYDYAQESYDSVGNRTAITAAGVREVPLTIEVYSASTVEAAGKASALQTLDGVLTALRLPSARGTLAGVGVVPFDWSSANYAPTIVAVGFRGRATTDVRLRMPARALVQYADWVASITAQVSTNGGSATVVAVSP